MNLGLSTKRAFRQAGHGLLICRDELMLPLRTLRSAHLLLLAYTAALIAIGIWAAQEATVFMVSALISAKAQVAFSEATFRWISLVVILTIWLLSIPFFVTAFALPARILWHRGNLYTAELLTSTLPGIAHALRALGFSLRVEFRFLIPFVVMAFIYIGFADKLAQRSTSQLFLLGFIAVGISTVWKSMPVLLAPLLAVLGKFEGRDAVWFSERVFRPKALELITIALSLFGALLAEYLLFHGHRMPVRHIPWYELLIYGVTFWYGAMLFCFKAMQALTSAIAREQAASPRPSQTASTQQPVFHIQNLWVQEEDGKFKMRKPG